VQICKAQLPKLWQQLPALEALVASAQLQPGPILVGLSGGVDSSVTALILKALGFEVAALFMKNWDEDDGTEFCTAKQDYTDAKAVADRLQIPLHQANFAAQYWDEVFSDFLASYQQGLTPNPDILCNREIKFQVFRDYARRLGFETIATGHYARIVKVEGHPRLLQAKDTNKDQTYFLQAVARERFNNVVFPLGCLSKPQVRSIAAEAGLITSTKKDSTGICFIGERRFQDFLSQYIGIQPGAIVDTQGNQLGEHQGLAFYTLGQRKGLRIGGVRQAAEQPWYVVGKELDSLALIVSQDCDHPALRSRNIELEAVNLLGDVNRFDQWQARVRHRQPLAELAQVSINGDDARIEFKVPQWAVTPGQYLAIYAGEQCLGGGQIVATETASGQRSAAS